MDKKQIKSLLIVIPVILCAAIYGYYKYLLLPLQESQKTIRQDMDNIEREYQESLGRASRLPMLEQEIRVLNSEILEMQKKLPHDKDVPGLIRLLSERMRFYGIQWKKLEPGNQTAKEYYIEHVYKIPFTSSYHNLARFLTEIGQMERIFATKLSTIRPENNPQGGTLISGEITFLIFTSK